MGLDLEVLKEESSSKRFTSLRLSPKFNYEGKEWEGTIRRILRRYGLSWLLSPVDRKALAEAGFTMEDMCRNIILLKAAERMLNGRGYQRHAFASRIRELAAESKEKTNPQGWIISALKRIVQAARQE